MEIRTYRGQDRELCLEVFDSNVPRFFAKEERSGFCEFLTSLDCPYFTMEHEGAIVGCGGYSVMSGQGAAQLVWGMIRGDSHGLGLGRFLLLFRLREIGKETGIQLVHLDAPQASAAFFQKQGFKAAAAESAAGRVAMVKKLIVCG